MNLVLTGLDNEHLPKVRVKVMAFPLPIWSLSSPAISELDAEAKDWLLIYLFALTGPPRSGTVARGGKISEDCTQVLQTQTVTVVTLELTTLLGESSTDANRTSAQTV